MTTIQEIRAQHPPFLRSVWADARITAAYRQERHEFHSHVDGALQVLRLMLVTDAFAAQVCYRAKARLQRAGIPVLPRLLHRLAMMLADVSIGDPVHVEPGVYIVHGQVVIDGVTRIGQGSLLFPWITIGLKASVMQGPNILPGTSVGTGAKVIGPVTVGPTAVIGANAVVVDDVPEGITVGGVPAKPICAQRPVADTSVLEQAEWLAAGAKWRDAISLLTRHNRLAPSAEVERTLVQLRHRAVYGGGTELGPEEWPPAFVDRFEGTVGIPEIPAHELDVEAVRAGVLAHGALIVRGLFSSTEAAHLRELIDTAYAAQDRVAAAGGHAVEDWYAEFRSHVTPATTEHSQFDRGWHRNASAVLGADSPRALFRLLELYSQHELPELVRQYLGETPAMSVEKTVLRRVPHDTDGGWHQDGAFLGVDIRSLNLWIAASDCGEEAPTMELVGRRLDHIVETGTHGAPFSWAVGDSVARTVAGPGGVVRPHFREGDVMFFDHMNLHVTSGGPTMTKPRYAVESWWFAPSHYPPSTLPLLV